MKKYLPIIAGIVLGLWFVMSAVVVLFKLVEMPPPPEGTPAAMFFGAFGPTGYLTFVKVCELLGGILVAIPRTRNFGLLVLGPIIVNILAFHTFIGDPRELLNIQHSWMLHVIILCALYLLWVARKQFLGLLNK
jgi:putative oxidoreductase